MPGLFSTSPHNNRILDKLSGSTTYYSCQTDNASYTLVVRPNKTLAVVQGKIWHYTIGWSVDFNCLNFMHSLCWNMTEVNEFCRSESDFFRVQICVFLTSEFRWGGMLFNLRCRETWASKKCEWSRQWSCFPLSFPCWTEWTLDTRLSGSTKEWIFQPIIFGRDVSGLHVPNIQM